MVGTALRRRPRFTVNGGQRLPANGAWGRLGVTALPLVLARIDRS